MKTGFPIEARPSQKGSALILVVMLMSLLLFVPIAMKMTSESFKQAKQELSVSGQADNAARAGIQAALFWFKRQSGGVSKDNPVPSAVQAAFSGYGSGYPYADAAFAPVDSSFTIDPTIGLVNEFSLQKGLKGRYEIRRQADRGPDGRLIVSASTGVFDSHAAHDVTSQRGYSSTGPRGMAWTIESLGIVYQDRTPSSVYFSSSTDRIVARSRMAAEFLRLSLQWPGNADGALIMQSAASSNLVMGASCRLSGGSKPGLCYTSNQVASSDSRYAKIKGTPQIQQSISATASDFLAPYIFSVPNVRDLSLVADSVYSTDASAVGNTQLSGLVFIDAAKMGGTATITKLNGAGIVFVNGNLTVTGGGPSFYNGILIVTGNLSFTGPASVYGATVVGGSVTLVFASEGVDLAWDSGIVNGVRTDLLQYRQNKAGVRVFAVR
jgi:hypothetical protein